MTAQDPRRDSITGLDEEQLQAVNALRGPVVIRAGAGAGKTRTITHRIAHGVRTGTYNPQRVLAVTFTRKAAHELQQRLHSLGAEGVRARTFHSAALAQLSYFWPRIVGGEAPKLIGAKASLLGQIVGHHGFRLSRESLKDLAADIEWRKVSMIRIEEYERVLEQRGVIAGLTSEQLLTLHADYERLNHERKQIDFEDVLTLMTGMLEQEPRVAAEFHETYRFFTVDEYQDISPLQHALLRAWLGERNDLCVVGDASQTIYSFAGASSAYLHRFSEEFQGATEIELNKNYRSRPEIVGIANHLMHGRAGALQLTPMRERGGQQPCFEWFSSEVEEARAVATAIHERITRGAHPSDIAVLYRSHGYALHLEEALTAVDVHSRIHGAERFFDRADVKRAVMEIRAQAAAQDDRPVFQVVSDVLRGLGWKTVPPARGEGEREKWEVLSALLRLVDEMPSETTVQEFSAELIRRSNAHHEPTLSAVTLSTIHAAKGLEWPLVWITGVAEGVLPISYAKDQVSVDEERRLTYVAITRAKDELRLSGAGSAGRRPSRFLQEAGIAVRSAGE